MTTTFTLGTGADAVQLGIDGSAMRGGTRIGNWRTTADNNIEVKDEEGKSRSFPVTWGFVGTNELALFQGETQVFNFCTDAAVRPGYEMSRCVIRFTPNRTAGFSFQLTCGFALVGNHDLEVAIGTRKSKLSGIVQDSERKNRFRYVFRDAKHPLLTQSLAFQGRWVTPPEKTANLRFLFLDKDGKEQAFELPGNLVIDKTTNQLKYEYDKGGKQSFQFDGTLFVNEKLEITYSISRVETAGEVTTRESVIAIGAVLTNERLTGSLEFQARRSDGGTTVLTIAGDFQGALTPNLQVVAGFRFTQQRANGAQVTTVVGFAGQMKYKDNATVTWEFASSNAKTRKVTLKVGADIKLRDNVSITFGADVQKNQVAVLLGFAF